MSPDSLIVAGGAGLIGVLVTVVGTLLLRMLNKLDADLNALAAVNEKQTVKLEELGRNVATEFKDLYQELFKLKTELAVEREARVRNERDMNGIAAKFSAQIDALRPR